MQLLTDINDKQLTKPLHLIFGHNLFFRSMERSLVMSVPLFDYNKEFAAVCEMLNVPLDVRKKSEDTLEILWSELDQQDEVEVWLIVFVCFKSDVCVYELII